MNAFTPLSRTRTRANNIVGYHTEEDYELWSTTFEDVQTLNLHFDIELTSGSYWAHLTHADFGNGSLDRDTLVTFFGAAVVDGAEDTAATRYGEAQGSTYDDHEADERHGWEQV